MSFVADFAKERGGTAVIPSVLPEAFEGLGKLGKL